MSFIELMVIAVGLSMDSFSVSVCKGIAVDKVKVKHALLCGGFFGFFQGFMPLMGYLLGTTFASYVDKFDHWIAFVLLAYIGWSMIKESRESEKQTPDFSLKTMFILAIATSIDALTIGVGFALMKVNLWESIITIGITTFVFSYVGVYLGHKVGGILGSRAELIGGLILIGMGIKILITGIIG